MANSPESKKRRAERLANDPTLRPHGDITTYQSWSCRCRECVDAAAEYAQDRRIAALKSNFANERHGTAGTYNLGCRCGACTDAKTASDRRSKARRAER